MRRDDVELKVRQCQKRSEYRIGVGEQKTEDEQHGDREHDGAQSRARATLIP
jgi:hypothetical protein